MIQRNIDFVSMDNWRKNFSIHNYAKMNVIFSINVIFFRNRNFILEI